MVLASVVSANNLNLKNCAKTKVDSRTNIFSCQSGDYLVQYKREEKEFMDEQNPIKKLGDKCLRVEDILKYTQNK
jgi:hypothetical protein